ncbi:MAG TPA: hypothetical protein VGB83_11755 [Actinomycetota bacterium]
MSPGAVEPARLLIARVWREGSEPSGFRARITLVPDLSGAGEDVVVLGSPEAVVALVERWLGAGAAPAVGRT